MAEQLDVYNKQRQLLGRSHPRGKRLQPEEWLLAAAVWVITPEKEILVTFRDPAKKAFPNYWENPGGLAQKGENSRQAIVRELAEETGIIARPEEFQLLCTSYHHSLIFDSYGLFADVSREDIVLEAKETVDARLVVLEELEAMVRAGQFAPPIENELREHREVYARFFKNLR